MDDAHKLEERVELNRLMRQEASDGSLKVIWIETEFYEETASQRPPSHVRIDFRDFGDELITNLYRSQNSDLKHALQGKVEGLDEAVKKAEAGQIRDVWHFAFVASQGERRIEEEISKLDNAETLVLFLISAYTVLSGESELSAADLMNLVAMLKVGWLADALRNRSLTDIIRSLQEYRFESAPDRQTVQRVSLMRLYDKNANDRNYVASLHYNSARAIVTAALLRRAIAENLVESLSVLLTSDYCRCPHLGSLCKALGSRHAPMFVKANEEWLVGFLSNPLADTIAGSQEMLNLLKHWDERIYRRMLDTLDLERVVKGVAALLDTLDSERVAKGVATSGVEEFTSLTGLLRALGEKRKALLDKVTWEGLAGRMSKAEVTQFGQVAGLLQALGEKRKALLDKVTWGNLAGRVSKAEITQFEEVAILLQAVGDERKALLDKVTWEDLAGRISKAEVTQFGQAADLLLALGDKRKALLDKIRWEDFAGRVASADVAQFDQVAGFLNALGEKREALLGKMDEAAWQGLAYRVANADFAQFTGIAHFIHVVEGKRNELLDKVTPEDFAGPVAKAEVTRFGQVAGLLQALGEKRKALLDKVTWEDFAGRVASADVTQFGQVAGFLNALGEKRKALLEKMDEVAWQGLADRMKSTNAAPLFQVAGFLNALGEKRKALLGKMDEAAWKGLADRIASADVTEFEDVASLLNALGSHRDALNDKLGTSSLVGTANGCAGDDLRRLTQLVANLNGKPRSNLIQEVDWSLLSTRCPVKADGLHTLGACLENVWRKAEMCAKPNGCQEVSAYLGARLEPLLRAVQDSYMNAAGNPSGYSGVAKFLFNCHRIDDRLAFELAERTMGTALQYFYICPGNYRYVGQLINAFHEVSPDLAKAFVENPQIRSRIICSLKKDNWYCKYLGARHLIKAIYRVCPSTWFKMLEFVTADLKGIDLESLYAEVSEAPAGREPSGPE